MDLPTLRGLLRYEPESGDFYWLGAKKGLAAGAKAGTLCNGYVRIGIDKRIYAAHALAWLWVYGKLPSALDHIDGCRSNNRIGNMRECSQAQNLQNQRRARSDSTSGLLGVSWRKQVGKWRACITVAGHHKELGHYGTKDEAYAAYVAAKRQLHEFNTI